jgi:hypothetical protein
MTFTNIFADWQQENMVYNQDQLIVLPCFDAAHRTGYMPASDKNSFSLQTEIGPPIQSAYLTQTSRAVTVGSTAMKRRFLPGAGDLGVGFPLGRGNCPRCRAFDTNNFFNKQRLGSEEIGVNPELHSHQGKHAIRSARLFLPGLFGDPVRWGGCCTDHAS